ncbi:MAG TPA: LysM peptidoglycan-binding domain-containing protein [Chthoniobacterales bacterium]|nr:LysM peptidoglycan-binding domain-containing protein [Chthoniobacterales bacterium]
MVKRIVRKTPRQQLRAAAPRATGKYSEDEYLVEEPNVKLSRAFVVVLLLHVVAVGGIFAFSALKDRQQGNGLAKPDGTRPAANPTGTTVANKPSAKEPVGSAAGPYKVRAGDTVAGIAAQFGLTAHELEQANGLRSGAPLTLGRELIIPEKSAAKPMPTDVQKLLGSKENKATPSQSSSAGAPEAEKYYVIQRGDTPASIAKKLKVNSADLLKINNIDDPRKLQIGQRLQIPSKID